MINLASIKKLVSLLIDIKNNTDNIGNVEIDVDQINLNTDGLEEKLDILNGKVATEEKQDSQINVLQSIAGFNIPQNDYISRAWTAGTFTEVWTFKTGGSGGTTVGIITIIYDDADQSNIVSVTKT